MTDSPAPAQHPAIPPDDPHRHLAVARPDEDQSLPHLGVVGDTYTILLSGDDTAGRYTLIDMHVPPGGGPPPHRHDFEEMFTVLDGEVELTFRGEHMVARAGQTVNVPANAPHAFTNASGQPARLLCMCSPSGQEKFFSRSARPWPPGPRHRRRSTRPPRRHSSRNRGPLLRSATRKYCGPPKRTCRRCVLYMWIVSYISV